MGDIRYTRAVTVPPGVAAAIRAGNAVIVVHGIDYDHNGIYDNILDRSDLDSSLPGEVDRAGAVRHAGADEERIGFGGHDVCRDLPPRRSWLRSRRGRASRCCATCIGVDATAVSDRRVAGPTAT